jgi:hypothetical protein
MQLHDGYIVGIYNYCDRWCETCPFTARCRVFATTGELDAGDDPMMAVIGAGLLRSTAAMAEALRTAASLASELDDEDDEDDEDDDGGGGDDGEDEEDADNGVLNVRERGPDLAPAPHEALRERAMAYGRQAADWLSSQRRVERRPPDDALGVVTWFHRMIGSKVDRAMHGLRDAAVVMVEDLHDAEGSAKVALLGSERSRAAWIDLVGEGRIATVEAAPFVDALTSIIDDLEALVPGARRFVRPGFDEPEGVTRLLAGEW